MSDPKYTSPKVQGLSEAEAANRQAYPVGKGGAWWNWVFLGVFDPRALMLLKLRLSTCGLMVMLSTSTTMAPAAPATQTWR